MGLLTRWCRVGKPGNRPRAGASSAEKMHRRVRDQAKLLREQAADLRRQFDQHVEQVETWERRAVAAETDGKLDLARRARLRRDEELGLAEAAASEFAELQRARTSAPEELAALGSELSNVADECRAMAAELGRLVREFEALTNTQE